MLVLLMMIVAVMNSVGVEFRDLSGLPKFKTSGVISGAKTHGALRGQVWIPQISHARECLTMQGCFDNFENNMSLGGF